jgi:hypothetical protein
VDRKAVFGAPLYGIKTGLNAAFVVERETRDQLVALDARSEELLVPFLKGENLQKWHMEPDDLWLINTPRNQIEIDDYPAIRNYLRPFRERLEKRATEQKWFELQQAQLACQPFMRADKILYPEFSQGPKFLRDPNGYYVNNKCFFIPYDGFLLALLNSKLVWFYLFGECAAQRGGKWRLELREQSVSKVPIPETGDTDKLSCARAAEGATQRAAERQVIRERVRRRIPDLAPQRNVAELSAKLNDWWLLNFDAFRIEIKRQFKADIPVAERNEWEAYLTAEREKVVALTSDIEALEVEIDRRIYSLFGLTDGDAKLLEESLQGQY